MPIILSHAPVAPPVVVNQWVGISCQWIGADGSQWDLDTGMAGAVLQRSGTEGLHEPPITKYSSRSRAFPGKRSRGWRADARAVFWPILVYSHASSEEWKDRYRAFFDSIHPEQPGTWRIGHSGEFRELRLTGVYDDPHAFNHDPLVFGWEKFGVKLEADQPFWTGKPVTGGPWSAPVPTPFIDPAGSPPFHISAGQAFGAAQMKNPGDVEAWPTWTLVGPLTGIELGIGTEIEQIPFTVPDGSVLTIQTDPRRQTAFLDGVDVTAALGLLRYRAIPPGSEVSLHVDATGTGSIRVSLVPLYFRAM